MQEPKAMRSLFAPILTLAGLVAGWFAQPASQAVAAKPLPSNVRLLTMKFLNCWAVMQP
jgi:hypothetical protein